MEKGTRNASIGRKRSRKRFLHSVSEKIIFVTLGNSKTGKTGLVNEFFERGE